MKMIKNDTNQEPTAEELHEELSDEDLSGPVINRRASLKILSAAGAASLAGCLGSSDSDSAGGEKTESDSAGAKKDKRGGTLKAGWAIPEVDTLDPAFINHVYNISLMINICNGLMKVDARGRIVGDLATDWTIDGTTWTFDLREDVKFHNGQEFTAEDVYYTIHRTLSKDLPAASTIKQLKPPEEGGVVVKDDYTVELNWKKPYAPGLFYLTRRGRGATIVNERAIKKMGNQAYKLKPVGTGPFNVTKHVVRETVVLERFDDYFFTDDDGVQLPYLDRVEVSLVPEAATATSGIRSGGLDFLNMVPPQSVAKVKKSDGTKIVSQSLNAWRGLEMNMTREPFSSRKFRQGIAKLIDKKAFVERALFGQGKPAVGALNPSYWPERADKPDYQNFDPEQGKRLIRESGYEGTTFKIMGRPAELRWSKALSNLINETADGVVNTTVNQVTGAQSSKLINNMNYDTWIGGAGGNIDPDVLLYPFYTPDGIWNWTGYDDPKTTRLLNKQRSAMNREKRGELIEKIEYRVMEDAPHAYLFHTRGNIGMQDYVEGYRSVPSMRPFHTVWLSK